MTTGLKQERGAALIMSLVILLILTLLGITGMSTSSLQQKMAGNTQEVVRALEAAESGAILAINTNGSLNAGNPPWSNNNISFSGSTNLSVVTASVTISFIENTDPNPAWGFDKEKYKFANFDVDSMGTTMTNARAHIHRGVAQFTKLQ